MPDRTPQARLSARAPRTPGLARAAASLFCGANDKHGMPRQPGQSFGEALWIKMRNRHYVLLPFYVHKQVSVLRKPEDTCSSTPCCCSCGCLCLCLCLCVV